LNGGTGDLAEERRMTKRYEWPTLDELLAEPKVIEGLRKFGERMSDEDRRCDGENCALCRLGVMHDVSDHTYQTVKGI
jgi:hypothetical protein